MFHPFLFKSNKWTMICRGLRWLHDRICCTVGWSWKPKNGYKMINKVSNTMEVGRRLYCMTNCTASPICDSCNYRPSDRTCQFNTHDTPLIANAADIIVDNAWIWYSTTFTVVAWTTPYNWQRRLHRVIFLILHRQIAWRKHYTVKQHTQQIMLFISAPSLCFAGNDSMAQCYVMWWPPKTWISLSAVLSLSLSVRGVATGVYRYIYPPKSLTVLFTCGTLTRVLKLQWLVKTYIPQIKFLATPLLSVPLPYNSRRKS